MDSGAGVEEDWIRLVVNRVLGGGEEEEKVVTTNWAADMVELTLEVVSSSDEEEEGTAIEDEVLGSSDVGASMMVAGSAAGACTGPGPVGSFASLWLQALLTTSSIDLSVGLTTDPQRSVPMPLLPHPNLVRHLATHSSLFLYLRAHSGLAETSEAEPRKTARTILAEVS